MSRPTLEMRRQAAQLAAQQFIKENGGTQSSAGRAAAALGSSLRQQNFGWAEKGQKLGEETIDRIAALFETTPDGLVRIFVDPEGGMALRDVPGWERAKREAQEDIGDRVEAWVWEALDHVVMPVSLRPAKPEYVKRIAQLIDEWARASGVRPKVAKQGDR